jgi:transposase
MNVTELPDDPVILKELLAEKENILIEKENLILEKQKEYLVLEEKFLTLQRKFFGRSSEKLSKEDQNQMRLFNEAELGNEPAEDNPEDTANESVQETIPVRQHERKKRGRKPLPENLPREIVPHDLTEEEKHCQFCRKERPLIGKEVTEELDVEPAKVKVIRHESSKYGPCGCEAFFESELPEVVTAKQEPRMIPGSIASPGLLAFILTGKFVDSLPFYRQESIFKRIGVEISRQNMCNWAIRVAERCGKRMELMRKETRSGPVIRMDETTLQVLQEPGRPASSKSYMWVTLGGHEGKPIILYHYRQSRGKEVPLSLLKDYRGFLQTDGYPGYDDAGSQPGIIHAGCFVHARRMFFDAAQLSKGKSGSAHAALSYIQKLYAVENKLRSEDLSPDEFVKDRKESVTPILEEFHEWLTKKKNQVVPESKLGEAVLYTLRQWHKLIRYLGHHLLTPDNNGVENAIRPFVVGRKNWIFNNTPNGANASAVIYSLIETAKANGLEPYRYLRYLFAKLPLAETEEEIKNLLPTRLTPEKLLEV